MLSLLFFLSFNMSLRPQSALSAAAQYERSPRYLAYVVERERRAAEKRKQWDLQRASSIFDTVPNTWDMNLRPQSAFRAAAQYERSPKYLKYVAEREKRAAEKRKEWELQGSSSIFDTIPRTWDRARVMRIKNERQAIMERSIREKLKKSCTALSNDCNSRTGETINF